jgi:hypothetical protein
MMTFFLKKYIENEKINSLDELCNKAIESNRLTKNLKELDFDKEEKRFFGDVITLEKKILQYDNIIIKNSKKIEIINCVIIGRLSILSGDKKLSIYLDNCIITDSISFKGDFIEKVTMNDCNFKKINFYNCKINDLFLTDCFIDKLDFEVAKINKFNMFCNKINFISKLQTNIETLVSSHDLIELKKIIINSHKSSYDPLFFTNNETIYNKTDTVIKTRIETIEFLKENNFLLKQKKLELIANYELLKISCKNWFTRGIVILFQGFNNPYLLSFYAMATIFIFSLFYHYCGSISCETCEIITFWDCLYFSGITFTTIGYGDIQPQNYTRFIAMFEGFLGIFLSSSILVSMVNKFAKNK